MNFIREEDITIIPVIEEDQFDYSEIFDIGRFPIPAERYKHITIMAPIKHIIHYYSNFIHNDEFNPPTKVQMKITDKNIIKEKSINYSEIFDIGRFPKPAEVHEHISNQKIEW